MGESGPCASEIRIPIGRPCGGSISLFGAGSTSDRRSGSPSDRRCLLVLRTSISLGQEWRSQERRFLARQGPGCFDHEEAGDKENADASEATSTNLMEGSWISSPRNLIATITIKLAHISKSCY